MKKNILPFSFILPALSMLGQDKADANTEKPNIIIIYCDDLGYGDIGITGHPGIKTPNLDKMGTEGCRFTNYYSASPASTASRYSLLTGKYPIRSGFPWVLNPDSEIGIHPQEITLAEALKDLGYKTAIYGKWHLGSTKKEYLPLQNGFDDYLGFPYSNDMIPPKFQDIALLNGNDTIAMNPDQSVLTELYTEKAISFMDKHKDEQFFIYVPFAMPHTPLHPGKKFVGKSQRGLYGDVVEEIDWAVGEILNAVDRNNLQEKTIIWFMSDNGPWLIRHEDGGSAGLFRDGKGSTWEGGMRVPCFVKWDGQIQNTTNDNLVNAMDVYTTCINLAGGQIDPDRIVDGEDISSYIVKDSPKGEKEQKPFFYYGIKNELMAVRLGAWKLHVKTYSQLGEDYFNGKVPLLFNVETDPSEKYDLSDANPDKVKEMMQLIENQNKLIQEQGNLYGL